MSASENGHTGDGGPAFPSTHDRAPSYVGMSLRDWFAGQALAGMLANQRGGLDTIADHASHAYVYADAMLVERARSTGAA